MLMVKQLLISIKLPPSSNPLAHPLFIPSTSIYESNVATYATFIKINTALFDNFITKSNRNDYYLLRINVQKYPRLKIQHNKDVLWGSTACKILIGEG